MMKEVRFKAIELGVDGMWLYGDLRHHEKDICIFSGNWGKQVVRGTVCQYIGQKDKEGNDIYEFDILKSNRFPLVNTDGELLGVVFWDTNDNMHKVIVFMGSGFFPVPFYKVDMKECVVVGNVHDDKDILGESEKNVLNWFMEGL